MGMLFPIFAAMKVKTLLVAVIHFSLANPVGFILADLSSICSVN